MSVTEKAAYLKGLYDGMGLNEEQSKEARMLGAIVDAIQELAEHVEENEEGISVLDDEVFELSEAVDQLRDEEEFDEDEEDDEEDEDEDGEELELELPAEIACPACGEPPDDGQTVQVSQIRSTTRQKEKKLSNTTASFMVRVARLELTAS